MSFDYSNEGKPSNQSPSADTDLLDDMAALSPGPSLAWTNKPARGQPYAHIGPDRDGAYKAMYHLVDDTDGALRDVADPVPDADSPELAHLVRHAVGHAARRLDWAHHRTILGEPAESRAAPPLRSTPTHLRYAVSRDGAVYRVRQARTRDAAEALRYPYALSNLVAMSMRRHGRVDGWRHVVFDQVVNDGAWAAMVGAFAAMGVRMPEMPGRSLLEQLGAEEEEEEGKGADSQSRASSSRSTRGHSKGGGGGVRKPKPKPPTAHVRIDHPTTNPAHAAAWARLHRHNPLTRALGRVRDELGAVGESVAYTLAVVAQERCGPQQTYWSALVAHLGCLEGRQVTA